MNATFFESPSDFRKWLKKNHKTASELLVGFYKKDSGKPSITWPESVDEALCVGWIDGVRRRVDDLSYTIRFTPRKRESTWSAVNIRRVEVLTKEGRLHPDGVRAFEARRESKSRIYAYEQKRAELDEPYRGMFEKNKAAWKFFQTQAPWYRKQVRWWVTSAKTEETRLKRLKRLIEASVLGRRV